MTLPYRQKGQGHPLEPQKSTVSKLSAAWFKEQSIQNVQALNNTAMKTIAGHFMAVPVPPKVVHALLLVALRFPCSEASIQRQRGQQFQNMLQVRLELVPGRALV